MFKGNRNFLIIDRASDGIEWNLRELHEKNIYWAERDSPDWRHQWESLKWVSIRRSRYIFIAFSKSTRPKSKIFSNRLQSDLMIMRKREKKLFVLRDANEIFLGLSSGVIWRSNIQHLIEKKDHLFGKETYNHFLARKLPYNVS